MAAERCGDISPGRRGRSPAPSLPTNDCNGAAESGANAGAELGVAASNTTILTPGIAVGTGERGDADKSESEEVLEISYEPGSLGKRGTIRYIDGDVYEGELKDDEPHGRGVYKQANGNVDYDGEWQEGQRHGTGTYHYDDGSIYEGEFENGLENGKGTAKGEDWSYSGDWKNGKRHGSGVYTYPSGDIYDGHWKDNKHHGSGIVRCANGNICDGEWEENKMLGVGTYTWASGEVYDGSWKDGVKRGKGTWKGENGDVYHGEWKGDKYHGEGTLKYANGSVYEGQWAEGKEHGKGTLKYSSGEMYEGQWVEGKRQGKFTWKGSKGGICEQVWVNGRQTEGRRFRRKARGPSPAVDGTTNPEVVGGANLQAPTSSRPQVRTCDQNDGGEEVESKATFGGATEEQQPEKAKRVYNHERTLRSTTSQQRWLLRDATAKKCEHCGADDVQYKLRVCSGCNLALYCSVACQEAARRSHQRICNIISELPSRDAVELVLKYDRQKMVDLDAGLQYGAKYMGNLQHLAIDVRGMASDGALKLSAKRLSSLLKSKKETLGAVFLLQNGYAHVPGVFENDTVWNELHGLKQLRLNHMRFRDVQLLLDIIGQQKDTLEVLCLAYLEIDWRKAKCRRAVALAVSACKHLVKLELNRSVLMDSDIKVMLQNLPNLRVLGLTRNPNSSHEFTDNTCGLIARKCPGLQELNLENHNHLSMRGVRKVFEGCPHLRLFATSTPKLSCGDLQILLDSAPQLMFLSLVGEYGLLEDKLSQIIEATGGRTVIHLNNTDTFDCDNATAKTRETYERQTGVLRDVWSRCSDPDVANEWCGLFEG